MIEDAEVKVGGFTFKGWYIAAALPILGSLSGGIYYGYDTLQRFYAVESGIETVVQASGKFSSKSNELSTRIQTVESDLNVNIQSTYADLTVKSQDMEAVLSCQRLAHKCKQSWNNRKTCLTYVVKLRDLLGSLIVWVISLTNTKLK